MDQKNQESEPNYWLTFAAGLLFIVLLGIFTYLFNYPI